MSLVKKKLQEISKKKSEIENKKKQKQSDKPIEVHNIYKDLIKKNSIFNDLKDLEKETKKITPHFFYNLNDNSNNYLSKLKKINFSIPNLRYSDDGEWLGCIIFADIYFKERKQKGIVFGIEVDDDHTNIFRIGYSIDYDYEDLKPNSWFYVSYIHSSNEERGLSEIHLSAFKTYDEMMSDFIERIMELSSDKETVFKKPVGGLLNLYRKSYDFTNSVSLVNYDKIHS